MANWLIKVTSSPHFLWLILFLGCLIGGLVVYAAHERSRGGSGIDAARIYEMRVENPRVR